MSEKIVDQGEYRTQKERGALVIESLDNGIALAMYNPESKEAFLQYIGPNDYDIKSAKQFIAAAKENKLLTARIVRRIPNIEDKQKIQASMGLVSRLVLELSDYLMPNNIFRENLTYPAEVSIDAANGKVNILNGPEQYHVPGGTGLHNYF